MTTKNLKADLDALPGVEAAEIFEHEDETPVARVWLDGTRDSDEVREYVDALLGKSTPSVVLPRQKSQRRRVGLGRGLGDLISGDVQIAVPTQFQQAAGVHRAIARVAVIESTRGVSVEIEDSAGRVHCEPVGDEGGIDGAVIEGVLALVGGSKDASVEVTDVETDDGSVLLVTVTREDVRSVGAAFIEYGRPYAVARAGLSALTDC